MPEDSPPPVRRTRGRSYSPDAVASAMVARAVGLSTNQIAQLPSMPSRWTVARWERDPRVASDSELRAYAQNKIRTLLVQFGDLAEAAAEAAFDAIEARDGRNAQALTITAGVATDKHRLLVGNMDPPNTIAHAPDRPQLLELMHEPTIPSESSQD